MKLLTRINRDFLLMSAVLLVVCSVIFYFLVQQIIYANANKDLYTEKKQITQAFHETGSLPVSQWLGGDMVEVQRTETPGQERLIDTVIYSAIYKENVPYRQLSFPLSKGNDRYMITVGTSRLDAEDFAMTILGFVIMFIAALFLVQYLINRRTSKRIWLPFKQTVTKMKTFDLTGATKMSFSHSSTEEFEELNQSLNKMTEKIYSDYDRLKQFTENASHEIQTPLSIILNKIEMLIQSENFSEEQMAHLQKINEAAVRLSRLNTALLTLTKIENRQYAHEGEFDLPCFIQRKIDEFQDFICQKNLQVSIHGDNGVCISMNPSLAELLFENLIRNAIKHNIDGGFIKILIEKNKFTISNSGRPLQLAADELFERFVKNDQSSDSLGLGLAMVKQICNNYGFAISFTSTGDLHNISICF